nr:hypothetical protein [Tanacetum cinerariifolium]
DPASPFRDDSQGKACLTISGLEAEQDRENIIKTSTLPHDLPPRVNSLAADEGNVGNIDSEIDSQSIPEMGGLNKIYYLVKIDVVLILLQNGNHIMVDVLMMKDHVVMIEVPQERVYDGAQWEFLSLHP